ncbi:Msr family ABC-F type ribosomal protection protein [Virgibacillus siamensis]|uniref:Msr family ABC-F type ribosomal protection protein n=1 Tax=Virgibacillus siamensis TaxID=480071 RepID=UPI00098726AC|nr:ABC-F type ribosomal protection protein [Virgibacillus siamensis]
MEQLKLEITDVEVSFLDQLVLDIPKLSVYQFDRIGLVGKNGSGKSTLLKLINGSILPDKGTVHCLADIGYFEQTALPEEGGQDFELLGKLSVPQTDISKLSGGEQTRMKMAQVFSMYHDMLLVDEPTTHLDTAGTDFLLDQLAYYYGSLILVSHDRYVLDQLVTKIWEIKDGRITEYTGNYSDYVQQKELEKKQQQEQHELYVKEKNRLLNAADKKMEKAKKVTRSNKKLSKKDTKAKANKMFMTKSKGTSQKSVERAAKAIEQRVEQLDVVEAPEEEHPLYFHQSKALQMHNKFPVMADRLTLSVRNKILLQEASFQFPLGATIAITGKNGSGKTQLLRHIVRDGENIKLSPKVVFGVYEQMDFQFKKAETVLQYMENRSDHHEGRIRAVLDAMNFTGNDMKKDVRDLSGGESIRLALCQLFLGRYNVLVLDEPTNFLDIDCMVALEKFLKGYQGTVFLVSHDRTFVERTADVVYEMKDKKLNLK